MGHQNAHVTNFLFGDVALLDRFLDVLNKLAHPVAADPVQARDSPARHERIVHADHLRRAVLEKIATLAFFGLLGHIGQAGNIWAEAGDFGGVPSAFGADAVIP